MGALLGKSLVQKKKANNELITCFEQFNAETHKEVARRKKHLGNNGKFNGLIVFCILANTIVVGVETDTVRTDDLSDNQKMTFFVIECMFGFIFAAEMLLRIHHLRWEYFTDPWNIFDYCLVILSTSDIVATLSGQVGGMRLAKSIRVFRLMRVVRTIKGAPVVSGLWMIIQGILDSARTIFWVAMTILILVYCFAVAMTTLTGHDASSPETKARWQEHRLYIGSVSRSMLTVTQVITFDQWTSDVARPLIDIAPPAFAALLLSIVIMSFGTLNILIAVMVERVGMISTEGKQDRQKLLEQTEVFLMESILDDFDEADSTKRGELDFKEFKKLVRGPAMAKKLSLVGISADEADDLFDLMDVDRSGTVSPGEFITGLDKIKGVSKGQDVVQLICFAQKQVLRATKFVTKVTALNERVDDIQCRINLIGKSLSKEIIEKGEATVRTGKTFNDAAARQIVIMKLDKDRLHDYPEISSPERHDNW